jgi:hypothetical protein
VDELTVFIIPEKDSLAFYKYLETVLRGKFPLPSWEGVRGRVIGGRMNRLFATPTLTLPHRGGGKKMTHLVKVRPLRESFINPKVLLINQYIVEQAPSPAKYSRGRLFYMTFAEVSRYL